MGHEDRVPAAVRAVVEEAAPHHHTTSSLQNALEASGFAPAGGYGKLDIVHRHLAQLDELADAWGVLIEFAQTIVDSEFEEEPDERRRSREKMLARLASYGVVRATNGRLARCGMFTTVALEDAIRRHDLVTVRAEFDRAIANIGSDAAAAMTAACAILEATFKTILAEEGIALPADQSIKPLWKAVRDHLSLAPDTAVAGSLKALLSGLASIVNATGDLRTQAGSAHGRAPGSWQPEHMHARLVVAAAQASVLFLLDVWESKLSDSGRP